MQEKNEIKPDFMVVCSEKSYTKTPGSLYKCAECGTEVFCSDESIRRIREENAHEFAEIKDEQIFKYCIDCGLEKLSTANDIDDIKDPLPKQIQEIADYLKITFEDAEKIVIQTMKDIRSGRIKYK